MIGVEVIKCLTVEQELEREGVEVNKSFTLGSELYKRGISKQVLHLGPKT